MDPNTLYYGDCLDWMSQWDDASVNLIYLDPPFNSNANYNILYGKSGGGGAQYRAFNDTWHWDEAAAERLATYERATGRLARDCIIGLRHIIGESGMLAYLTYMAERLEHMRRLLKPTGSIYLHCDPTASHYLKLLMDAIFGTGPKHFRNEIIWHYRRWTAGTKNFQRMHDVILRYAVSSQAKFNIQYEPYGDWIEKDYRYIDEETGKRWRWHTVKGVRQKVFLEDQNRGVKLNDVWTIPYLSSTSNERLGYPTQKPLALLKRIVESSSDRGDLVFDPFCGCGTAIDAARRLGRNFVGVDISSFAIDLIREKRLKDMSIPTKGIPFDLRSAEKLASEQPFNFETWAVTRLPGFAPNTKRIGDSGIDGRAMLADKPSEIDSQLALAQIKGGGFNLSQLRDFVGVTRRDNAALGCYVTLEPVTSQAAKQEVLKLGNITVRDYRYPRMQLWSISDYFNGQWPRMPIMNDPYTGKPQRQLEMFTNT